MGTALITGASSGLGEEYAWQLAAAHHRLILVARDTQRLQTLADRLFQVARVEVEVLPADLSTRKGRLKVTKRILDPVAPPVGLVINNAGFGLGQDFPDGDLSQEQYGMRVMVQAVLEISHAAVTAMVPRGHGAILNVSSMCASTTMGTYAAHKAWIRTFTEAISGELRNTGVTATCVCPGLMRTEFHQRANFNSTGIPRIGWIPASLVAEDSLRAVRRGQVLCVPAVRYRVAEFFLKHAPRAWVRTLSYRLIPPRQE